MQIAIGSDHRGVRYKSLLSRRLEAAGHQVEDLGTDVGAEDGGSCDYPDFAFAVARRVAAGEAERGILICSSGMGMSMAANRVRGVRAALCVNPEMARLSRRHNNSNVLCLGQDMLEEDEAVAILDAWLATEFEGGRHERRVGKLDTL